MVMFSALFVLFCLLAGIVPGVYQSFRHILGYESALIQKYGNRALSFILRAILFALLLWFVMNVLLVTSIFGLSFAILNVVILGWMTRTKRFKKETAARTVLCGVFSGGIAGGIFTGLILLIIGGAAVVGNMGMMAAAIGMLGGGLGGLLGGIVNGTVLVLEFMGRQLGLFGFRCIAPFFILPRFGTIVCNHCYRVTSPLKSRYDRGRRYCENCGKDVEDTKERGRVVLLFGDIPFCAEGRVFVLSDPDFETKEHHIEVSDVYLDPQTCDKRLLERFITYSVNYPPSRGAGAVRLFHRDELSLLGENLKNALRNTFGHIEQIG